MIALIDEVFATRNDPDQLQVSRKDMKKLEGIHPSTLSQVADENGPSVWILLFPTTNDLMNDFLTGKISEQELLDKTKIGIKYDAIYLCSATALPEFRGKGLAKKTSIDAINTIKKDHSITSLFVWPFTKEGGHLAEIIAKETGLPLKKK